MESSEELLKTLLGLITSDNPIIATLMSIALVVLVFALVIATVVDVVKKFKDVASGALANLQNFEVKPKLPRTDDVKKRMRIDKVINDLLSDVVHQHGIDRALLCQFHNGTTAKSGMPFEYAVLTHEADAPGVAPSTLGSEQYDIRLFSQVLTPLVMEFKSLECKTEDMSYPIRDFLNENGSRKFIAKVLTDAINSDYVIGVAIFTKTSDTPFEENIEKQLSHVCDICSGILSTAWGSCDQCARKGIKGKDGCPKANQNKNTTGRCDRYKPNKSFE